ncbi:MAG TPA: hypothetical protein VKA84_10545 [Gemmatimonadaceae bacterium]|nr:hypothetical protein [Gemmatimonadaceae bacterium]
MRRPALSPRDRRALRLGAWMAAPVLVASLVVRPYLGALGAARAELAAQRTLLARELGALHDAPRDARLVREGQMALAAAAERLFDGGDAVAASGELAGYVSGQAEEAGVEIEESETRSAGDSTPTVDIRARGDVLALADFLHALEAGPKLARAERISIVREPPRGGDAGDGTLTLTATITGRSMVGRP